nr:MAG TPA: hypothetical protein [Caudoviricetes sp.]
MRFKIILRINHYLWIVIYKYSKALSLGKFALLLMK